MVKIDFIGPTFRQTSVGSVKKKSSDQKKQQENSNKKKKNIKDIISIDVDVEQNQKDEKDHSLSPTRYGDWEYKGRCIDF